MSYKIPFIRPSFPSKDEITKDFLSILESNWFTNFGPFERRLCAEVAGLYDGGAHVTTIANATLGLQAAVDILLKEPGENNEVLVPSFTFAAGPEVLIRAGFKPIFIDIEAGSWQPSYQQAEAYLAEHSNRVAGILLCNSFGVGNLEVGAWETLASEYALPLIIDSAAGFGSRYSRDERVGLRGDCEVFSMHATKPFAVGEGGLVISENPDFIAAVRSYQNFGFGKDRMVHAIGTNAKLQELNCAIGLRQLEAFEHRLVHRRQTLRMYRDALPDLQFMKNSELSTVPFASVAVREAEDVDLIIQKLGEAGVEVRQYYSPLHVQPVIAKHSGQAGTLEATDWLARRILSLPVHDGMEESSIDLVAATINSHLKKHS